VPQERARVGVATCALAPDLDEDGPLLLDALRAAGADPRVVRWDDDTVDWGSFDSVLVRSTWDYPLRRREFLAWSQLCRRTTNPADVLAWNTDKRYLDDLSRAGVATVPTVFVEPGAAVPQGWASGGDVVVKPAVSGSAADTGRFRGPDDPAATALVAALHAQGRTAMVQPYLPGIDTDGETSLVFLGGRFSHAVRREPLLGGDGVRGAVVVADVLATVRAVAPTVAQLALAERTLDAVPGGRERLGYARVDVIPGAGGPVLLELEATDCFLFLSFAAPAARARMAEHVLRPAAGPHPR
jgi:glutathione synthase/RimK-type ligase-like ATP-grasp enzyme